MSYWNEITRTASHLYNVEDAGGSVTEAMLHYVARIAPAHNVDEATVRANIRSEMCKIKQRVVNARADM